MAGRFGTGLVQGTASMVAGLLFFWAAFRMADKNGNAVGNAFWTAIAPASLIMTIAFIIGFFASFTGDHWLVILGICSLCMFFVYMCVFIMYLLPCVKNPAEA